MMGLDPNSAAFSEPENPSDLPPKTWESKTFVFLEAQGWNPAGANCLLAVSGGADSTALLHFWVRTASPKLGGQVGVAHINHGLRPDAAKDEAFVASLCSEWKLPFFCLKLDPSEKPVRESVEMWARRERYRFYAESSQKMQARWILTGHHRDDLVETVFQRLGRGTGAIGLAGIPFRREPGIIRPFLNRSRFEILTFLESNQITWREDESNADTSINRNWFRHLYLPRLREADPDLDLRVFNMAMQLQRMGKGLEALEADADLLSQDALGRPFLLWEGINSRVQAGDREGLTYWLRTLVRKSFPENPNRPVTKMILDEFCRQWQQDPRHLQVQFSQSIAFKCENSRIYASVTSIKLPESSPGAKKRYTREIQSVILEGKAGSLSWKWENQTYHLTAKRFSRPENLVYPGSMDGRAIFDADLFSCTLSVRNRLDGDCFSPFGVNSRSRKLKAFLNEKKIPVAMRDKLPIVLSGGTLAWVPGLGISEFFKVSDSTSFILELVLKCENP